MEPGSHEHHEKYDQSQTEQGFFLPEYKLSPGQNSDQNHGDQVHFGTKKENKNKKIRQEQVIYAFKTD